MPRPENVGHHPSLPVRGDSSQLDRQGVTGLLVVVDGVVVAAATVKEPPPAVDGAVCQVEPQVCAEVASRALPALGRNSHAVVQLNQVLGVLRNLQ